MRLSRRGRSLLVVGVTAAMVAGAGAVALSRAHRCGEDVTSLPAERSTTPFLDAEERAEQPDPNRDALVGALAAAAPPYGEVVGAVGYHYERWAQVASFAQGIGVRTRDNPDFTMLDDETLTPRWSVAVETNRSAYDASAERYAVTTMPTTAAPETVMLDADNGERVWCHAVGDSAVGGDDTVATQFLANESLVVSAAGRLTRLAGDSGDVEWDRKAVVDDDDFLGSLGRGLLVHGGSPLFRLLDPDDLSERDAGTALAAIDEETGEVRWTRKTGAGTALHVVGTDPAAGLALVVERRSGEGSGRLLGLDRTGAEVWSVSPASGSAFDAAVRSGRVLVRAGTRWSAYDVSSGELLWQRTVPDRPQFLPYGFELESVPLLDADHALIGSTTALQALDLTDGAMTPAALPTDGINTTYWPYQLAVSDGLIAVATNTGAVVVRRDVVPGW